MEVLGSAATIVQLVSFTGEVLATGYGYLRKVKNAPLELKNLLQETAAIDALLEELEGLTLDEKRDSGRNALQSLEQLGILTDCVSLIKIVEASLKACQQIDGQQIRNVGRRMVWPFKAKETKDTMDQLRKMREVLSAAVIVDSAVKLRDLELLARDIDRNVVLTLETLFGVGEVLEEVGSGIGNIAVDVSAVRKTLEFQLRKEEIVAIRRWLYPDGINTQNYYEAALKLKEPQTGTWMINCREFKQWQEHDNGCLWIYGFAGCGKTVMSATVIEHLGIYSSSDDSAVVFFFCDRRDPSQQTFLDLLFSITKQLVESSSKSLLCLEEAKVRLDANFQKNQAQPSLAKPLTQAQYIDFIQKLCSNWKQTSLVIDALDECSNIKEFANGLKMLQHGSNIKFVLTSRDEHNVRQAIYPLASQNISLQDGMNADIHTFLSHELRNRIEDGSLKLRDKSLETQIITGLEKKADGIILIAKLQLQYICDLRSDRAIKEALESLPSEIYPTYDEMLRQLCSKYPRDIDDLKYMLLWLAYSKAPLTVEQLAEIVSIRPGDETLDKSGIATDAKELLQCCGGLVTIRTDVAESGDYEDLRGQVLHIVTLSHASVEEYLKSPKPSPTVERLFGLYPAAAELTLAKKCLQYVGFDDFKYPIARDVAPNVSVQHIGPVGRKLDLKADRGYLKARVSEYPFYDYACQYWPEHLRIGKAESPLDEETHQLLTWFLKNDRSPGNFISWQQMYHHDIEYYCPDRPALYYAIEFQIQPLVLALIPPDSNLNELVDDAAPLHIASRCGATSIMSLLLHRGASVSLNSGPKQRCMTPLHFAAEGGHLEAIKLLLAHGAPVDARSRSSSTPFYRAARSGSLAAMKLLKDNGSDIEAKTFDGWTALFEAAAHGRRAVAAQLLEWGADPAAVTSSGESALTMLKWVRMEEFFAEHNIQDSKSDLVTPPIKLSSPEELILADIHAIRSEQPAGLKKWYPLLKDMKRHYYYLERMEQDTRSARQREKDQRWVVDPRYIIKSSEFRDKDNPFGEEEEEDSGAVESKPEPIRHCHRGLELEWQRGLV